MGTIASTVPTEAPLLRRLAEARARSDELFEIVHPAALYDRPIPERHRIVFYLGHLETFDAYNLQHWIRLHKLRPAPVAT
jgi:hypothetical protein